MELINSLSLLFPFSATCKSFGERLITAQIWTGALFQKRCVRRQPDTHTNAAASGSMLSVCGGCVVLLHTCLNSQCTDANSVYCLPDTTQIASTQTDGGQLDFNSGCLQQLPYLPISTHTDSEVRGNGARCRSPCTSYTKCPRHTDSLMKQPSVASVIWNSAPGHSTRTGHRTTDLQWAIGFSWTNPAWMFWKRKNTKLY